MWMKLSNFRTANFSGVSKIDTFRQILRSFPLLRLDFTKSQAATNSDMGLVIEIRIE